MNSKQKKVYVTGATGFIGEKLVQSLVQKGYKTTCLVRSPDKAKHLESLNVSIVKGDITNRKQVQKTIQDHSTIYHLAAWYEIGVPASKETLMRTINVAGTKNVLEEAWKSGAERIIYCSTVGALGNSGPQGHIADEHHNHDGKFQSLYVKTKYKAHQIAERLIKKNAPLIIVLPGAVYGPGDTSLVAKQMKLIINKKLKFIPNIPSIYCYTHVNDVVNGMMLAEKKGKIGEKYILTGPPLTIKQFYQTVANQANINPPKIPIPLWIFHLIAWINKHLPADKKLIKDIPLNHETLSMMKANWAYSSKKAQKKLGWKPRSLQQGLPETLEWIQHNEHQI